MPSTYLHFSPFSGFSSSSGCICTIFEANVNGNEIEFCHLYFVKCSFSTSFSYCYASFTWHRSRTKRKQKNTNCCRFVCRADIGNVLRAIRDIAKCLQNPSSRRKKKRNTYRFKLWIFAVPRNDSCLESKEITTDFLVLTSNINVSFFHLQKKNVARGYAHNSQHVIKWKTLFWSSTSSYVLVANLISVSNCIVVLFSFLHSSMK